MKPEDRQVLCDFVRHVQQMRQEQRTRDYRRTEHQVDHELPEIHAALTTEHQVDHELPEILAILSIEHAAQLQQRLDMEPGDQPNPEVAP